MAAGAQNLMTTAGGLLFGRDGYGSFIAIDAKTGKALWHQANAAPVNPPITFVVDGRQHMHSLRPLLCSRRRRTRC